MTVGHLTVSPSIVYAQRQELCFCYIHLLNFIFYA